MPFSCTASYTCLLKVTSLKAFSSRQSLVLTQFWLFHSGDDRVSPAYFQSLVSEFFVFFTAFTHSALCTFSSDDAWDDFRWFFSCSSAFCLLDRQRLTCIFLIWKCSSELVLNCVCPVKGISNTHFYGTSPSSRQPESLCKPSLTYFSHSPYQSVPSLCDQNEGFDVCIFPLYVFMTISCSLLERHNLFRWEF